MCYRRTATKAENHGLLFDCTCYIRSNSLNQYFYLYNVDELALWWFLKGNLVCWGDVCVCESVWRVGRMKMVSFYNVFKQNVGQDCQSVCVFISLWCWYQKLLFLVALFSWYMILYHADGWKCVKMVWLYVTVKLKAQHRESDWSIRLSIVWICSFS